MESRLELDPADGSNQLGDDSVSVTMSKKRPRPSEALVNNAIDALEKVLAETPKPRVTSFVARECTCCTALRESDEKAKGKSFSRVYGTVGRVRYVRCDYCGNTWKQTPDA